MGCLDKCPVTHWSIIFVRRRSYPPPPFSPLQLVIRMVQNRPVGKQGTHGNKTNKVNYYFKRCELLVVFGPSASLAFQHGGCVPSERLTAKGLRLDCNLTEAISDIVFEGFLVSTISNQTEGLSREATIALSVVGAIVLLCTVLGFAFFCFIHHQRKKIAEYRSQLFPVHSGKHQVKYHVKRA